MITLEPELITPQGFEPYGDVIATAADRRAAMNTGRFERFDDLGRVETDRNGRVAISIARCRVATQLPYRFDLVERHPHGSQAFIPLSRFRFVVVVAPPSEAVEANDLRAFITSGRQGINYRRGTWHMPLIAFEAGQEFLVIDRLGDSPNCDEHSLGEAVMLAEPR